MFLIIEKIDKALESKEKCTLVDKMGHYFHGHLTDSWARVSGGKMRGKIVFASEEKGEIQIDVNDVLELIPSPSNKG